MASLDAEHVEEPNAMTFVYLKALKRQHSVRTRVLDWVKCIANELSYVRGTTKNLFPRQLRLGKGVCVVQAVP